LKKSPKRKKKKTEKHGSLANLLLKDTDSQRKWMKLIFIDMFKHFLSRERKIREKGSKNKMEDSW
jgi:hypothetical protein